MVNLANKYVTSVIPPKDKSYIRLWDATIKGFGIRVTDNDVKSFFFEGKQKLSKKIKQVKIGRAGEMSASEARASAPELSRQFRSGEFEKPAQSRQGDNLTALAAQHYSSVGLFGKSSAHIANGRRHLLAEFCKRYGTISIQDITRQQAMSFVNVAKIKI